MIQSGNQQIAQSFNASGRGPDVGVGAEEIGGVVLVFQRRQTAVVGGCPQALFAVLPGIAQDVEVDGPPGNGRAVLKARSGPGG